MKRLPKLLFFSLLLIVGCSKEYDDSALTGRVKNLENRVLKLEQLCQQMNANISSLQTIVSALQSNDYVAGVVPVTEGGKTVGYRISFTKSQPVTIYHGKDGIDGKNGADGKDGQDGADGKSYVPVIGVRQDTDGIYYWTLDGKWLTDDSGNKVKAEGRDGKDGLDGKDGQNGSDGKDGIDGKDGQDGANGTDGRDGVTPVLKIEDNFWFISYDNGSSWTKLGKATGADGRDGVDGKDGKDGENGRDGVDGKDGKDGENGSDGVDGKDGKDGITPLLQIIDGYWYASYDNGSTWQELGKATGADGKDGQDGVNGADGRDGDTFFKDVTQDDANVHFILADGTVITIPKAVALDIVFEESDLVVMSPNSTRTISFTVTSTIKPVAVEVVSSADVKAKVISDDADGLTGKMHLTTGSVIDEYSKVVVFVSNGEKVIMRSIRFEEAGLKVEENSVKTIPAEGGEVALEFMTNVEYEVVIPDYAKSWISVIPDTRAMEKRSVALKVEPNADYYRNTLIAVRSSDGRLELEYKIEQNGALGVKIDAENIPDNEIWYTTEDNSLIRLVLGDDNKQPFNSNIVSHVYENGIGVIVCDAPIKVIRRSAFSNSKNMTGLFLPNSITDMESFSLGNLKMRELHIPSKLQYVGSGAFLNSSFERFTGAHTSEDGRLVYLESGYADDFGGTRKSVQGYVAAFASFGLKTYTLPSYVKELGWETFSNIDLNEIVLNDGLEIIDGDCFSGSVLDCEIRLPVTLKELDPYAFRACSGIRGFYGNNKFHTDDHHCLIYYRGTEKWINRFVGDDIVNYTIPEGVACVENYTFDNMPNLKTISFPSSITFVGSYAINNCPKLEAIYGGCTSEDHRAIVFGSKFSRLFVAKGIKKYVVPEGFTSLGHEAFGDLFESEIEEIILPDSILELGGYDFTGNQKLKKIVLSKNLKSVDKYNPFFHSYNLEEIYFRSFIPPIYTDKQFDENECTHLTIYVPEETLELYKRSGWAQYAPYMIGYKYDDIGEWIPDYYISSDFTQDGTVTTIQSATEGKGINIVLMGDAYSDRQIADGTYGADMKYIYDNLFTEEPYKSFREYFNVYSVNVVSATEGYEHEGAALGGYFGDGTLVGGNDSKCFEYAAKAVGEQNMDETLVVVAMNSDKYAGTCYMYYPSSTNGTYGSGTSVAYFPKGGDKETFARLLHHEACGHGFAKLADEYAYESMGTAPSDYISQIQTQQSSWGWWKNVDFTGDLSSVRWSGFISDSRYTNEGLGAFEGSLTYWSGVWRPTENSIMRDNTGGYNAPSREAIYCRIHKLAYGDSWNYSYEDFVAYDEINRKASSLAAPRRSAGRQTRCEPLHPPVVVDKSWKDAAKRQWQNINPK